ncbi:MAG: helix-turn-helix domain-containing protein, partial [Candidatus Omnitrophica bacterium]|nr:helix-turn-helix domain-containing protein [Candidatus Omnitrophota bacterium]
MGVIHKLKPEIINFIIENKRENPALSCRDLSTLLLENLHVKVSKSSINNVFKDNKLSMPI